ncbi:MAG: molybdenum cofactor biosynthesis protein MoaE [Pseudomonadota bacterium]
MITPVVRIQAQDFDVAAETRRVADTNQNIGAIVTFTGLCRDEGNRLQALELEHYPGMAERQIGDVAHEAIKRFDLSGLVAIHRYGIIRPGENIVLVVAAARHRQAAFDGANFLMDYLKTSAPFWKKEHPLDGSEGKWVEARDADNSALDKWEKR